MVIYKYSSSGNTFGAIFEAPLLSSEKIFTLLSHEYLSADGLFLVHHQGDNNYKVSLFNADSSKATVSGNGLRGLYQLFEKLNSTHYDSYFVELVDIIYEIFGDKKSTSLLIEAPLKIDADHKYGLYKAPNYHLIKIVKEISLDNLIDSGNNVNPLYNLHHLEILGSRQIKLYSYERGVGLTSSCGSGALSSYSFLKDIGLIKTKELEVITPGGKLYIKEQNGLLLLTGDSKLTLEAIVDEGSL